MKKIAIFLVTICCLISCLISCSFEQAPQMRKIEGQRHDSINVRDYVYEREDIYGKVLVFDSIQEAYMMMDEIREMDMNDLRNYYHNLDYYNFCIESHLYYDSLFVPYCERYGYEGYCAELVERNPEVLDEMWMEVQNNPNPLLFIHEDYEPGRTSIIVEPYGDLEWDALTNEKGIFIVGDKVHFFLNGDHWVSTFEFYETYSFESSEALLTYIVSEEDSIYDLPEVYYYDYTYYRDEPLTREISRKEYSEDNTYMMKMDLTAHADYCRFYGYTKLFSEIKIKNYKIGPLRCAYWLTGFDTDIHYSVTYEAYSPGARPNDVQLHYDVDVECAGKKINKERYINTFCFDAFPYPECGFIDYSYTVSNGRVTIVGD